jgi:predicted lipase
MPLPLIEDALGDPRNAQAMAVAADLSYFPQAEGAAKFQQELGMTACQFFSVGNTQAYVLSNDDHILVVFRGTEAPTSIEGLKDWLLTDALNLLIVPEGRLGTDLAAAGVGARFHQGFVNAIADIWDPVLAAVEGELKKKERPLWITGHSLGGALALFAAWLFQRKMINVHQIYTFGAPMIGNELAAKAFDREFKGKIFRYVNTLDPVPQLPTMSLIANQYGHCLTEVPLGGAAGGSFFQGLAGSAVDGALNANLIDIIWKTLQERVGAHAMDVYRGHLKG